MEQEKRVVPWGSPLHFPSIKRIIISLRRRKSDERDCYMGVGMSKYVMSLDAGTTSERAIIFDHDGTIVSVAQKEITQYYPQAGWVEHDPLELWSVQLSVAVEAMSKAGIAADEIDAIGITNQRETTIV